MIVWCTWTLT